MVKQQKYDVIIAGCGVAGLYAALQFDESKQILMLSKREDTLSNSSLAQGGVAAVLDFENDSFDLHYEDTLIAGGHENTPASVDVLVHEGPDDVRRIMELGVDFDKAPDGRPQKTLEGGHSRRRIVHHKDQTGYEIVIKLLAQVRQRSNIELAENTTVCEMAQVRGGFRLDLLCGEEPGSVFCSYCILATGGIGRVYRYTTNSSIATGDGIRLAYELGAQIKNLSYVQFHPTAFHSEKEREQFLISEAVRGEGAYLLNCERRRFMAHYDDRLELAPRDVVSRAIILESRRTGSNQFFLDITYKNRDFLYNRFPAISKRCLEEGVDIAQDLIPVFPCQHYLMGGIAVDLTGRTAVPRLYAAGECSNTGVHGANRLASNSLLEALVFGRHAAEDILRCMEKGYLEVEPPAQIDPPQFDGAPLPHGLRTEIRDIMQRAYFVIPNPTAVHTGLRRVEEIRRRLKSGHFAVTRDYCEALSLATVASIILREVDDG